MIVHLYYHPFSNGYIQGFMNPIQKVSSRLLIVFNILLFLLPLSTLFYWLLIDTEFIHTLIVQGPLLQTIQTTEGAVSINLVPWDIYSKLLGLLGDVIGLLPLFLGLFVLKSIFRNYKKREIFTLKNANHYKRLGWLFFFNALIAQPLNNVLLVLAITSADPTGHRYLTFAFGIPNVKALFCGLLVIVISWVMVEGSKLQEEQKLTI